MKKLLSVFLPLIFIYTAKGQNVGIGTSTPTAKLEVNGTFKLTDGTEGVGMILTSDATGLASWQPPPPPPENPTDYPEVHICCSIWMSKNLDVDHYRNGDTIAHVTNAAEWAALTTGAYCYYNNDSTTYAAIYGKLYNWYAVNDPRGLAPEGWHVPTDFEWTYNVDCLGGASVAGGFMKEFGTDHWTSPNTGATNVSEFNGLPGGFRNYSGTFGNIGNGGSWWSSTQTELDFALWRFLNFNNDDVARSDDFKGSGFSVRCLKN